MVFKLAGCLVFLTTMAGISLTSSSLTLKRYSAKEMFNLLGLGHLLFNLAFFKVILFTL